MKDRPLESGYYGIPKDVEFDGMTVDRKLCRQVNRATNLRDQQCHAMTKVFYLQFQYFPFFIASLAVMYYMPYILFRINNADMISLKSNLKSENIKKIDAVKLVENYFNYDMNGGKTQLRLKIVLNFCLKLLYVVVNILGFLFTNNLLNYDYKSYGLEWIKWSRFNNTIAFDYSGIRKYPKPGNILLPAMGFCEITEGSKDIRSSFSNQNKFICEISPNVLYQYVLIVLWFLFIISITIVNFGVVLHFGTHLWTYIRCLLCDRRNISSMYATCKDMTFREIEYIRFIRTKNLPMYGDVIRMLQKQRCKNENGCYEMEEDLPCRNNALLSGSIS